MKVRQWSTQKLNSGQLESFVSYNSDTQSVRLEGLNGRAYFVTALLRVIEVQPFCATLTTVGLGFRSGGGGMNNEYIIHAPQ